MSKHLPDYGALPTDRLLALLSCETLADSDRHALEAELRARGVKAADASPIIQSQFEGAPEVQEISKESTKEPTVGAIAPGQATDHHGQASGLRVPSIGILFVSYLIVATIYAALTGHWPAIIEGALVLAVPILILGMLLQAVFSRTRR